MYMHMKCLRKVVTSVTALRASLAIRTLRSSNIKNIMKQVPNRLEAKPHDKMYHRAGKSQLQQCVNA